MNDKTRHELTLEMERARKKFPDPRGLTAALYEEFGEWADEGTKFDVDPVAYRKEILQVACVALRIYEEGDPDDHLASMRVLHFYGRYLEHYGREVLASLYGEAAAARSVT